MVLCANNIFFLSHNTANEIVSIDDKKPVVNDKNGNMLRVPKPSSWSENLDLVYDAWNRLVEVKDVATYTYDATQSGDYFTKALRLDHQRYPSNELHYYHYSDAADDLLNRPTNLGMAVRYEYTGLATPSVVVYQPIGTMLDYTQADALDRFNRVIRHAWKKSGTPEVDIHYTYDRAGNRVSREDLVAASLGKSMSENYAYDGLNQLTQLQCQSGLREQFTYDATGNWTQYVDNDVVQTRTHNAANEIVSIDDKKPVINDKNGNMLRVPKPSLVNENFDLVYDAWNRLVKVVDNVNTVATYTYDGLNRRVKKIIGTETRTFYYNRNWQCLEEYVNGVRANRYLWGLRYIDDLIEFTTGYVHALTDANYNVVAVTTQSGVTERYTYSAFGKRNVYDAYFVAKSESSYPHFTRSFTGQVLDMETGLMLYRNRVYHPMLGRFVQRDPIGYSARDMNLYRYVGNRAITAVDIAGNWAIALPAVFPIWPVIAPIAIGIGIGVGIGVAIIGVIIIGKVLVDTIQTQTEIWDQTETWPETEPSPDPSPKEDERPPFWPDNPDCDDDENPSCENYYPGLPKCKNYSYSSMAVATRVFTRQYPKGLRYLDAPARKCFGGTHRNIYLDGDTLIGTIICCPCCNDSEWPEISVETGCNIN